MSRYASSSSSSVVGILESTVTPELDWELLFDVYADRLRRIISRKVGPALTEDVLQETFLRAFRNRHTIDPTRPIAPWLITIALRAATDAQRRQLRTVDSELVEQACEENGFSAVEEDLIRRARALGIKHALASLNTKQRRMLEAVAVEGLAYDQLAAAENMSPHAVKTVIARARTNFRSSYSGFTRSTELFGGAVGAAMWKVRARLQRFQDLVSEHAAAFGAATLTVAAVGIAAYPAARAVPTRAAEISETVEAVASAAGAASSVIDTVLDGDEVGASGNADAPSSGRQTTDAPTANDLHVTVTSDGGIARDGDRAYAGLEARSTSDAANTRTWAGMGINCEAGWTGKTECTVVDILPPLS